MNVKKSLGILLFAISMSLVACFSFSLMSHSIFALAANNPYSIVFNQNVNKLHSNTGATAYSGSSTIKTNLKNNIEFEYVDLMGLSSTWHVVKSNGCFYNTTSIHGIESVSISFKTDSKDFKIFYSYDGLFDDDRSVVLSSSTAQAVTYNFENANPAFLKVQNISGSNINISEIVLKYSCENSHPIVSISSEDEAKGYVYGTSGAVSSGSTATVYATPKKGYKFLGWYDETGFVSSERIYSFVVDSKDVNLFARFSNETYNFLVESESTTKGSVSDLSGQYDYLEPITVSALANNGYSFNGWYSNDSFVSSSNPYSFQMPYNDYVLIAKFNICSYQVHVSSEDDTMGSVSGEGTYIYNSGVTIAATPNTGFSFIGWYKNSDLISISNPYSFNMPHYDIDLIAKFDWAPYSLELTVNDESMGFVTGMGSYLYNQNVTINAYPNEHYSFAGWYQGEDLISIESNYSFNMPAQPLDYQAKFVNNYSLYIFSDNQEYGTVEYPNECGEGLEATIYCDAEIGYAFDYWYDEDLNEISYDNPYTFAMPAGDITLYAAFTVGYTLTAEANIPNKCVVKGGGQYAAGRSVTVSIDSITGQFKGWFDSSNNLKETSVNYTFSMPSNDYYLEARFMTQEELDIALGITPTIDSKKKTVTYGLYPQWHIENEVLIDALNNLDGPSDNGWYLYRDEYYFKYTVCFEPYVDSTIYFNNGDPIIDGETYWFKCEPIVWGIYNTSSNRYYLSTSLLIDGQCYYHSISTRVIDGVTYYPSDYGLSDIRGWLNNDFYNSAFFFNNDYVEKTDTCGFNNNVFLMSRSENASMETRVKNTDFTKARGAFYEDYYDIGKYNCGFYWTRTPYSNDEVYAVGLNGINYSYSVTEILGIRPSIVFKR